MEDRELTLKEIDDILYNTTGITTILFGNIIEPTQIHEWLCQLKSDEKNNLSESH